MYSNYNFTAKSYLSQDEDSGSYSNSFPSFNTSKPKRASRLGKVGLSLPKLPNVKPASFSESDKIQENTNEDSNSHTGSESSLLNWMRDTPVKNDSHQNSSSPPLLYKTNTVQKYSSKPIEKSSSVNYIEGIRPLSDFNQFPEKNSDISENPFFISECKQSLTFKSCEQKSSVLQDVVNFGFIHKTPGSKTGYHHFEKEIKKHEPIKDKENYISQLFQTPNICDVFNTDKKSEHKTSQSLNFIFTLDSSHPPNSFGNNKLTSGNILKKENENYIDPQNNCNAETLDRRSVDNIVPNDNPLNLSKNNCKISSNNNENEVMELIVNKDKEQSPNKQNLVGQSAETSSFNSNKSNIGINTLFSNGLSKKKNTSTGGENKQECKFNDYVNFNPFSPDNNDLDFLPFNHKSQNHIHTKSSGGFPLPNIFGKPLPGKSFDQHIIENKGKENVLPSITISPSSDSNSTDQKITVFPKLKSFNGPFDSDNKKNNKNNIDLINKTDKTQSDNNKKTLLNENKEKLNDVKENINYSQKDNCNDAPSIPVKPTPIQQSNIQQKTLMAPPSSNMLIKSNNRGNEKSSSLRTHSVNRFNPSFTKDDASSHQTLYVNNKPYVVLSTLGKGGSSEVFLVLESHTSKLMAVKCVNLKSVETVIAEGYLNEVELLLKLQGCDSVIHMFDHEFIKDQKLLYVVMEKGDTDLSRLIRDIQKKKKISMSMIIYYWTEMLNAVKDIHEKGIIHSDLKPANFLLVCGRLKLIDFGIASSLQGDMTSVQKEVTAGTWNYMSPEAIKNNGNSSMRGCKINYKSDVWSLGCILYNLVYKKTPFSHISSMLAKLTAIINESHVIEFPKEMEGGERIPPFILKTLKCCLIRDPKQRPSVQELLDRQCYEESNDLAKDNIEYVLRPIKDHVVDQLKNILSPENLEKISHILTRMDNFIFSIKNQVSEEIKRTLPSEWEKIAHIFVDSTSSSLKNSR